MIDQFRVDFAQAVKELEKKHKVRIDIGNISYDSTHFTTKLTVEDSRTAGKRAERLSMSDLVIGQRYGIDSPKNKGEVFVLVKKNRTKVEVRDVVSNYIWVVPPAMLYRV